MKYKEKEIADLTDVELLAARDNFKSMHENYNTKTFTEKYQKKMLNQPIPKVNPVFLELKSAIETEIEKRKI